MTLKAKEGFIYTNGTLYGKEIYLGVTDSAEHWYEITESAYEQILKEMEEN